MDGITQNESSSTDICLNTYDLKQRLKSEDSKNLIICKDEKDGIWYSGVVAFGKEYVFSQLGVESSSPGETLLGEPTKTEKLGNSEIPYSIFFDYLLTLGETKYKPGSYNLRSLNGNTFSDDLAQFLCGVAVPKYILHLPHIVYESPIGEEEVLPLVEQLSAEGNTVGGKSGLRSSAFLSTYIPKDPRQTVKPRRQDSPELEELQAQIDALKANQRSLDEKREKFAKYKKREKSTESSENSSHKRRSPTPPRPRRRPEVEVDSEEEEYHNSDPVLVAQRRGKRVSFDDSGPQEIGAKFKSTADEEESSSSKSQTIDFDEIVGKKDEAAPNSSEHPGRSDISRSPSPVEPPPLEEILSPCIAAAATDDENYSTDKVEEAAETPLNLSNPEEEQGKTDCKIKDSLVEEEAEVLEDNYKSCIDRVHSSSITSKEDESPTAAKEDLVPTTKTGYADNQGLSVISPATGEEKEEILLTSAAESAESDHRDTTTLDTTDLHLDSEEGNQLQKHHTSSDTLEATAAAIEDIMADQEASNGAAAAAAGPAAAEEAPVEVPKKNQKPKEPPVTFREFNHTKDFEDLVRTVVTMLSGEEQDRLREMEDWIIKGEGTWVLAEGFNAFLGRILHDKTSLPSEARVAMMRLMAFGAEQDDIVLILHMDRKDHLVMNYAQEFDRLPILEQEAIALFFANLFENNSSSEWLLYISEWSHAGQDLSNIRVTTKVAVNALLGDTPALQEYGSAIMHNLGTKEVFDDVCTELAMAIMQFFQGKPPEEQVFRCMKALNKFCTIAHREVPQLVKMIGPDPAKFTGMSARTDQLIQDVSARLATVPMF